MNLQSCVFRHINEYILFIFELACMIKSRNMCLCVNGPLSRYVKLRVVHAPGMPGKFSPPPRVSDPDMHHGTCVTHVPWCTPGSLTSGFIWSRRRGKTFQAFPAHAQPAILRIWQEAHWHWYTPDWCQLNKLQALSVAFLVTHSCVFQC